MKIQFSKLDIKRNVIIPSLNNPNLAEEIGIHIGDGSMNIYDGVFLYSLRGHKKDDKNYYTKIIPVLYKKIYNIDVHIREWVDVIGFQLVSKAIVKFKHKIGFPYGPKTNTIKIPKFILKSEILLYNCLRGIFDTDGTLSFEKKSRNLSYYPRIIFSTTSKKLNTQLIKILQNNLKFNLSYWKQSYSSKKWNDIYRICIRGNKNINRWFEIIGSDNPKNIFKYNHWKEFGYCPLHVHTEEKLAVLNSKL